MMKRFKSVIAAALAAVTCMSVCACGGDKEDSTKTYLDVGVFDAGLGTVYFDEMKKDFEAYYANESFEDGKTGVVLRPTKKNTEFNPAQLLTSMKDYQPVLYLLNTGDYEAFTSAELFTDVSDVMTEKYLDENGEIAKDTGKTATQSIEDTMLDGYSDVFKKDDGKYYAVPFMYSAPGIIFDADLFDEQSLYFKADGTVGANAADLAAQNCSAGTDGKSGTYDDGLPATWEQFLMLLSAIRNKGLTPFTWAESPSTYQISRVFNIIHANYEGYDDFMLNYSLSGTDNELGEINDSNYDKLLEQEGRKAAIKAFYDITKNAGNYSVKAAPAGGNTHTTAEREFIQSKRYGTRIAMFVENSYWEQEARSVFDGEPQPEQNGYGKRNFKYLTMPKFVGMEGVEDQTNEEARHPHNLFRELYVHQRKEHQQERRGADARSQVVHQVCPAESSAREVHRQHRLLTSLQIYDNRRGKADLHAVYAQHSRADSRGRDRRSQPRNCHQAPSIHRRRRLRRE